MCFESMYTCVLVIVHGAYVNVWGLGEWGRETLFGRVRWWLNNNWLWIPVANIMVQSCTSFAACMSFHWMLCQQLHGVQTLHAAYSSALVVFFIPSQTFQYLSLPLPFSPSAVPKDYLNWMSKNWCFLNTIRIMECPHSWVNSWDSVCYRERWVGRMERKAEEFKHRAQTSQGHTWPLWLSISGMFIYLTFKVGVNPPPDGKVHEPCPTPLLSVYTCMCVCVW